MGADAGGEVLPDAVDQHPARAAENGGTGDRGGADLRMPAGGGGDALGHQGREGRAAGDADRAAEHDEFGIEHREHGLDDERDACGETLQGGFRAEAAVGATADQVGEVVAGRVDVGRARHRAGSRSRRRRRRRRDARCRRGRRRRRGPRRSRATRSCRRRSPRRRRARRPPRGSRRSPGRPTRPSDSLIRRRAPSSGQPCRSSEKLSCSPSLEIEAWMPTSTLPIVAGSTSAAAQAAAMAERTSPSGVRSAANSTSTTGWSPSRASTTVAAICVLADVDGDAARAVDAHPVADGVRAAAAGDLADRGDEAGLLEAGDHLRGGRLRHAGELAEPVAREGPVLEQRGERRAVVALAEPGRRAGGGRAHGSPRVAAVRAGCGVGRGALDGKRP